MLLAVYYAQSYSPAAGRGTCPADAFHPRNTTGVDRESHAAETEFIACLVRHPNDGDGTLYALTPKGERALPALIAFVDALDQWDDAREGGDRSGRR